jgi:hypothetical protein
MEVEEKVKVIQERLRIAQNHQKQYVDRKKRPIEQQVGDYVYLKVSPLRGTLRF